MLELPDREFKAIISMLKKIYLKRWITCRLTSTVDTEESLSLKTGITQVRTQRKERGGKNNTSKNCGAISHNPIQVTGEGEEKTRQKKYWRG